MKVLNILGWIAVFLIVSAYGLNIFSILSTKSLSYIVMNLLGSAIIAVIALKRKDEQPAILNIIWCLIAIVNLVIALT